MKKFLKNSGSFLFLIVLVVFLQKIVLNQFINPFWGRTEIRDKVNFIKSEPTDYDMIFVGSSKTYRQIIPAVIDSITHLKSFNLGLYGIYNPEEWYIIEHFINEIPTEKTPKYLVIELQGFHAIAKRNMKSTKTKYFADFKRMSLSARFLHDQKKYKKAKNHVIRFLENQINIGMLPEQIETSKKGTISYEHLQKWSGYYPLEKETGKQYRVRQKKLSQNTKKLDRLEKSIGYVHRRKKNPYSLFEKMMWKDIINQCDRNNIIPIFLIPPRSNGRLGIFRELETANKIDLSDPKKYPEFYSVENSFDWSHLNSKGSRIYSIELANKLAEIID